MKRGSLIIGLAIFCLVSCGAPAIPVTPSVSVTVTPAPPAPAPTVTLILSPTAAVTSTPAIPPEARLKIKCLDVASTFPPSADSKGIIILESEVIQGNHLNLDTFLMDMATGAKTLLTKPNEDLDYFVVSPDRQRMAYEQFPFDNSGHRIISRSQLVVATMEGEVQKLIPWAADWGWGNISEWLDNERLVIGLPITTPGQPIPLLLLNPFTGQRRRLRSDFPDIFEAYPPLDWEGWGETVYNPKLTRVVYAGKGYVLWDMESRRALVTFGDYLVHPPRWSPDGTQFVVASDFGLKDGTGFELFSVEQDGQPITRLTNLSAYYSAVDMWGYSWSPDGRRLAFWLNTDIDTAMLASYDTRTQRLAVLDLATQEVTDYCIPLEAYKENDDSIPFFASGKTSPIWSPNSQQLIIESHYAKDASRVIIVDVAHAAAVQIAENMMPVGWMKSSP